MSYLKTNKLAIVFLLCAVFYGNCYGISLTPITAMKSDLFFASKLAYLKLTREDEKFDIKKYYLQAGRGDNVIFVSFIPLLYLSESSIDVSDIKAFWINDKNFSFKTDMKYDWYNTEAIMRGDLFLAAYLSSLDIDNMTSLLDKWKYNVILLSHRSGIFVDFELQFNNDRNAVLDSRTLSYFVNRKTFDVVSKNRGNSGHVVVRLKDSFKK